jgi:hypothetical protein
MINPELNDWWSRKRLTSLRYKETSLSGAGISMQVLAKAFNENEFTWFSIVYGELDDNLILFAMDNQAAHKFSKTRYESQETKRAFFGQVLVNEYKITAEIASELGLTASKGRFEILNKDKILYYIHSHDNCFFSIEPVSANLLKRVIQAVLQQHSYYLGKEIQWAEIESQLIEIIRSNKEIDIQSDPKKQCVWIPQIERNKGWFWKSLRHGTIIIDGEKALFRD